MAFTVETSDADVAHYTQLAREVGRFLQRPADTFAAPNAVTAPPGAPIGDPALDWLMQIAPACSLWDGSMEW